MCRAQFSPYQADFWEWAIRSGVGAEDIQVEPKFDAGSLVPRILAHSELALRLSEIAAATTARWSIVTYKADFLSY